MPPQSRRPSEARGTKYEGPKFITLSLNKNIPRILSMVFLLYVRHGKISLFAPYYVIVKKVEF